MRSKVVIASEILQYLYECRNMLFEEHIFKIGCHEFKWNPNKKYKVMNLKKLMKKKN